MGIDIILLTVLVIAALWTVMTRSLLRAGMGLAVTSAVLSIVMFRLNASLAAVFELSVCAGLISVLFISTISLTESTSYEEVAEHMKERMRRFWYLPLILIAVGVGMSFAHLNLNVTLPKAAGEQDVRFLLWNLRQLDIIGQVIVLLTGVFGVVILFKERQEK